MPTSINTFIDQNGALIRLWVISLGFAVGCGTIYTSVYTNGSAIEIGQAEVSALQAETRAHEIEYVQLRAEVLGIREIIELRFDNFEKMLEGLR